MSGVDGAQHVIPVRKAVSCGADGSDRGGVSAGFHSRGPQRTFTPRFMECVGTQRRIPLPFIYDRKCTS